MKIPQINKFLRQATEELSAKESDQQFRRQRAIAEARLSGVAIEDILQSIAVRELLDSHH
jgi:hypothetical protein